MLQIPGLGISRTTTHGLCESMFAFHSRTGQHTIIAEADQGDQPRAPEKATRQSKQTLHDYFRYTCRADQVAEVLLVFVRKTYLAHAS